MASQTFKAFVAALTAPGSLTGAESWPLIQSADDYEVTLSTVAAYINGLLTAGAGAGFDTFLEIENALAGKQPLDADLTAIAGLVSAANKFAYATGAGAWALADLTAAGRALLDDADAAAQRTTLNVDASRLDLTMAPILFDEFLFGSTESGEMGELGWGFTNGTWTVTNAVANHPGIAQRTSTAAIGEVASAFIGGGGVTVPLLGSQIDEQSWVILLVTASTDADYRFGFFSDVDQNPPAHGAYFEKLAADTNWFGVNRLSAAQTRADLGVAAAAATWFKLKIRRVNATTLAYSINGAAEIQIATNSPEGVSLAFGFHVIPTAAAARSVNVDAFAMRLQPNAR